MIEQSEAVNSLCCAVSPKASKTKVSASHAQREEGKCLPAPHGVWASQNLPVPKSYLFTSSNIPQNISFSHHFPVTISLIEATGKNNEGLVTETGKKIIM